MKLYDEARVEYLKLPRSEASNVIFKQVDAAWLDSHDNIADAIKAAEANKPEKVKEEISKHIRGQFHAIEQGLEEINKLRLEVAKAETDQEERLISQSETLNLIGMLLAIVLTLGFGYFLARGLTNALASITTQVGEAANQVNAASQQLSGASQQLSAGATEAASSLEETSASLEEMTSMVKLNADHAKEASALSVKSRESAEHGETEIKQLITAMGEIGQSSKKIEEIINVIDDIAFQTNLLALNAAVEAARAGEQGKGFAVVAEAVRSLAQRSATAAKDITSLIKESVAKVDHGAKIADSSGVVLKEIVTSVKKVSDLNNEIATASSEQASGINQINQAMNNLDKATQDNAASAEEASASSEELSAQATVLNQLIGDLTLVVHGAGAQHKPQAAPATTKPVAAKTTTVVKKTAISQNPDSTAAPKNHNRAEVGAPVAALVAKPTAPARAGLAGARETAEKVIPFETSDDKVSTSNLKGF
jgi:methyl-accepting chemotaxis protein